MHTTNQLVLEHDAVLKVLDIFDKISQGIILKNEPLNTQHVENLLEIQKVFIDDCHHGKEERVLFEAMTREGFPKENGPVGVMLHEHDTGRNYIKEMRAALEEYKKGDASASRKFATNASYYSSLMKEHIYKENNILYPMAETHLPEETKQEILHQFTNIQTNTTPGDQYQKYLKAIDELGITYLGN